jgi:UPF0716 protein FxsA
MNVAKWLLLALLTLPLAELVVFIVVASYIGFAWAVLLVLAGSLAGAQVLRHAGGNHIARVRVALDQGSFTAMQADGRGGAILLAGILLLIPGFITDAVGLAVLASTFLRHQPPPVRDDGVVDLAPEQWQRVPDQALPGRRADDDDERHRPS